MPNRQGPRTRTERARTIALSTLITLLVCGCAGSEGTKGEAEEAEAVGVWQSPAGGRMEFYEDGRFTATNIAMDPKCTEERDAFEHNRTDGSGTWKLEGFPDEGPGTHIVFEAKDRSVRDCEIWTVFVGDPGSTMHLLHQYGESERYRRTAQTP